MTDKFTFEIKGVEKDTEVVFLPGKAHEVSELKALGLPAEVIIGAEETGLWNRFRDLVRSGDSMIQSIIIHNLSADPSVMNSKIMVCNADRPNPVCDILMIGRYKVDDSVAVMDFREFPMIASDTLYLSMSVPANSKFSISFCFL